MPKVCAQLHYEKQFWKFGVRCMHRNCQQSKLPHYAEVEVNEKKGRCLVTKNRYPLTKEELIWFPDYKTPSSLPNERSDDLQIKRIQIENRTQEPVFRCAQGIIFIIGVFGADGTARDVENMESTFKELNFSVFIERDPTSEQIACLMRVAAECTYPIRYKYIAFYFAGHGGKDEHGKFFIKGLQKDDSKPIILHIEEYIVNPLTRLKRFHRMFFFDCCQTSAVDGIPYRSNGTTSVHTPKVQPGVLIAYSSSGGQKSFGDIQNGGIWTHHLCRNLKQNNLTITDVLTRTADAVRKERSDLQEPLTVCSEEFHDVVLKSETHNAAKKLETVKCSELLKKHVPKIIEVIDNEKMATELWAAGLITDETKSYVLYTPGITIVQKASKMTDEVYKTLKVSENPTDILKNFCDVLKSQGNTTLSSIGQTILERMT